MPKIKISNENVPEFDSLLGNLIYAFNTEATEITDGEMLNAVLKDEKGNLNAAISGHTWGGCCEIVYLWVNEDLRGSGIGSELLQAAEQEAIKRGCHQIVLSTHSFHIVLSYQKLATIPNYPKGYEKYIYIKSLVSAKP